MECKNCELRKRQFICADCLTTHVRQLRLQIQHYASERDEQVSKASLGLNSTVNPARLRRANVASIEHRISEIMAGLSKLRRDNDRKRERLQTLRETLAARRRTLAAAKLLPNPVSTEARETQDLNNLSATLARARSGLVQELVEVFNVVEVGGRPPIGGKSGTKGEWTIGDLILPVPGDIRRYPPDHINAVITHTIHFLSLLTFYLGIKLPFEITWTGKKLGVGQPWIGAIKGGESGSWAKWSTKQPLHWSSAGPSSSQPGEVPERTPSLMSDSYIEPDPQPQSSFSAALAMLLYNVSYLAYTQGVDVPLNQAGDVLSNLWSVCCSAELGKRSHQTHPLLPPPTPTSFKLDFAQLLQANTMNPASRARISRPKRHSSSPAVVKPNPQPIPEVEEDGWDLLEDAGFEI